MRDWIDGNGFMQNWKFMLNENKGLGKWVRKYRWTQMAESVEWDIILTCLLLVPRPQWSENNYSKCFSFWFVRLFKGIWDADQNSLILLINWNDTFWYSFLFPKKIIYLIGRNIWIIDRTPEKYKLGNND